MQWKTKMITGHVCRGERKFPLRKLNLSTSMSLLGTARVKSGCICTLSVGNIDFLGWILSFETDGCGKSFESRVSDMKCTSLWEVNGIMASPLCELWCIIIGHSAWIENHSRWKRRGEGNSEANLRRWTPCHHYRAWLQGISLSNQLSGRVMQKS